MLGLYERDYTKLTNEEIKEKEKIDKTSSKGMKYGRKNLVFEYPKAIRHFKSLFPNNYMDTQLLNDTVELEKQCNEFEKLLSDKSITELNIKRYIQKNMYYHIPGAIFSRYSFGHHEATLFKEFSLGTYYKTDYLLAGRGSGGWQFVLVEFENPYGGITLQNGDWGENVRKGLYQIEEWKTFVESSYSSVYEEFLKYTNQVLPDEFRRFDSSRMNYVIVAGRRQDFENATSRLKQRSSEQERNIKILHYDNLLDDARRLIGAKSY